MVHTDSLSCCNYDPPDWMEVFNVLQFFATNVGIEDCLAIAQRNDSKYHGIEGDTREKATPHQRKPSRSKEILMA